ncbi:HAMP domain-containing histidine kinase [Octadecabacter sp. CECT 8868]|uniref:sensor histidine kinase n=1 Tax=Octadecabacter algicola TaxID=2909342 RepID=UPI001F28A5D6|nr:HAMP domain-containing sensor histidine kinase [Octadecabacter algicola]MCF2906501.1 HAMP domain-containing histidine kinase [Octadecabacter algicola]
MSVRFNSLRVIGPTLVLAALVIGAGTLWTWTKSSASWRAHSASAYAAGVTLYYAMQNGTAPPEGVSMRALPDVDQIHANAGTFRQIHGTPKAPLITIVPILPDAANQTTGAAVTMAILSPSLTYGLADLPHRDGQTAAETMGEITRKLAVFCSDPFVVARMGDGAWVHFDGQRIWGCAALPPDRRILAGLVAVIGTGILMTVALNLPSSFSAFAGQLRNRRRVGGPTRYEAEGPQELQEIVGAVNSYLEIEREQLAGRAAVLSGVSHDLGTPATRLRLRAALVQDQKLRRKFEADLDSMTGIIESVLTYTHVEMGAEKPRNLSLTSLLDAVVANYQDVGRPVTFRIVKDVIMPGAKSIFMSRQGYGVLSNDRDVVVSGRPVSLERAITNLIDNALKYGRRATVSLETDARTVTILVEDEGSQSTAADIENLLAPFQRGENTATIDGHGLGLTIVATIAKLHGGSLSFEDTATGIAARFVIQRD